MTAAHVDPITRTPHRRNYHILDSGDSPAASPYTPTMEWREVAKYPGWYVSACGLVRNGTKLARTKFTANMRVVYVGLGDGEWTTLRSVVARAFLPEPEPYCRLEHIDGDPRNCAYTNLRWAGRT